MNRLDAGSSAEIETIEISEDTRISLEPLISVYMLAYRHERFIAQAIEGVIAQRCQYPIELIIGEDCSPDGTRDIVLGYQKRHPELIRVLTARRNVGAHANAERCLRAVRGKYVALCEGDDFWHHPQKLAMQVEAFLKDPGVTLCHTEFDRRVRFGTKTRCHAAARSRHVADGMAYEALLHEWTVITATAMYRTDTLREFQSSPFRIKRWPFGDYNKALYAAATGRVAYIPVSTATWRKVVGSMTNESVEAYLNMAIAYEECRELFMEKFPVSDKVARSVRNASKQRIMDRAFWAGRKDLFEASLRWLNENSTGHRSSFVLLRQFILDRPALIRLAQSLRTRIRNLRLVNR